VICLDCKAGGDYNALGNYDKAEELHEFCKGDCTCLHRTGPGWYVKVGEKATPMRVQSP
jgi:hypothetical protein